MTWYAAYDSMAIYAIGQSRDKAIAKARDDARDDEAQFETAIISIPLAYYIEANGWDGNSQSFDVHHGEIRHPRFRGRPCRDGMNQPIDPTDPELENWP